MQTFESLRRPAPAGLVPSPARVRPSGLSTTNVIQRQTAEVERASGGLPCVLTTESAGPVDESVNFSVSSVAIAAADSTRLQNYAARLPSNARLRVDGYASVDGPQELNWRLSCERALAIRDELTAAGVSEQRIVLLAHGETKEFSRTSLPQNRRASVAAMQPAPSPPPTAGPAFAQTAQSPSSPLPPDTIRTWRALSNAGDRKGALRAVVWAMERRGEIDPALIRTEPSTHIPVCQTTAWIELDASISGAVTESCSCIGPTGSQTPNPRVRLDPLLVDRNPFVTGTPKQTRAEVLHSTLLHEFRHVRQNHEQCNGLRNAPAGICTDCNSPSELDSYLSEIEAGYDTTVIRHAWVRVFVNFSFLSARQQRVFRARRDAAEVKVTSLLPSINWDADAEVVRVRNFCNRLGPPPRPHIGTCADLVSP